MKTTSRITALIIFSSLLLTACGGSSGSNDTTTAPPEVTTAADIFDGMNVTDYNERKFNFLIRSSQLDSLYIETETGEALDDSIYKRNALVEERFNIVINPISIAGDWNDRAAWVENIRSSIMANDGAYDLIEGAASHIGDGFADRLFLNLNDVSSLRLDREWWSDITAEALTYNGKLFAMTGDLSLSMWSQLHVLFFNKDMMDDLGKEYPYAKVKSGDWTLEAFMTDIKDVARDLNNDDKWDFDDQYGYLIYDSLAADNLRTAFDAPVTKTNSDGTVELDLNNEKMVNVFDAIVTLVKQNSDSNWYYGALDQAGAQRNFSDGLSLYFSETLSQSINMRDAAVEFGIVPLPKYDSEQDGYYTTSRDGRSMFAIPTDAPDVDFSGTITEALNVASHDIVIPVYYDITLSTKAVRDDESAEMLDIIRKGLKLNFVAEYGIQNYGSGTTGGAGQVVRFGIDSTSGYASYVASNIQGWEAGFEKFIEAYED